MRKVEAIVTFWPGFLLTCLLLIIIALALIMPINIHAQIPTGSSHAIIFHDAEPVLGRVGENPVNLNFELVTGPHPIESLLLVSDGRVLIQGLDYTLRSDGKIEILETKLAPRKTLTAWYRVEH